MQTLEQIAEQSEIKCHDKELIDAYILSVAESYYGILMDKEQLARFYVRNEHILKQIYCKNVCGYRCLDKEIGHS